MSSTVAAEDTSSTAYKGQIIGRYIIERLEQHKAGQIGHATGASSPLMVAMQGPQGCGKTTLTDELQRYLSSSKTEIRSAVLSLDDLYLNNKGLLDLSTKHPENRLLFGRGLPGTHDVTLARATLEAVLNNGRKDAKPVHLPIFDKSAFGGRGDRSSSTVPIDTPIDVFILEGWSMGIQPLGQAEISRRYDQALRTSEQPGTTKPVFLSHSLESLIQVDEYLKTASAVLYPAFTVLIRIRPRSYSYVYRWRREQEHQMITARGAGMTDEEVDDFVARYMPGYELWAEPTNVNEGGEVEMGWKGNVLTLLYGKDREVISVEES